MAILQDLNKAKGTLQEQEKLQILMKAANKVAKSKKLDRAEKTAQLIELGIERGQADQLLTGDYGGRVGFAGYQLTSVNLSIKRLRERISNLEDKRQGEVEVELGGAIPKWTFTGGYMIANYEADRYQLFFDDIPDKPFRDKLKKTWNWSRRYGAWQRKITKNAMYDAKYLLDNLAKEQSTGIGSENDDAKMDEVFSIEKQRREQVKNQEIKERAVAAPDFKPDDFKFKVGDKAFEKSPTTSTPYKEWNVIHINPEQLTIEVQEDGKEYMSYIENVNDFLTQEELTNVINATKSYPELELKQSTKKLPFTNFSEFLDNLKVEDLWKTFELAGKTIYYRKFSHKNLPNVEYHWRDLIDQGKVERNVIIEGSKENNQHLETIISVASKGEADQISEDYISWFETPEKELNSWKNTFFVNDSFMDNRYNSVYTITAITTTPETDNPSMELTYDDGTIRTLTATELKYNHDQNQHYKAHKYSNDDLTDGGDKALRLSSLARLGWYLDKEDETHFTKNNEEVEIYLEDTYSDKNGGQTIFFQPPTNDDWEGYKIKDIDKVIKLIYEYVMYSKASGEHKEYEPVNNLEDYETERSRQTDLGIVLPDQEGISIMGMMKGKNNPVDKLRKTNKELEQAAKDLVKKEKDVFDIGSYKNQYVLNEAIAAFLDNSGITLENANNKTLDVEIKNFIRAYSGFGGLDKYGATGKGGFLEYYTPTPVIKKMWALAYKYGYNNGAILETSVGTGEFLQFSKPEMNVTAYDINYHACLITKLLYPTTKVYHEPFEKHFIKDRFTIKDETEKLEQFELVIGNCPYGKIQDTQTKYMSMGELDHVKPKNYTEYFLRRSLDCLKPKGLIVMIVGSSIQGGGTMFLDQGESHVKDYLAANADLLAAYRLPDSTFERTQVTSDILVIQKK